MRKFHALSAIAAISVLTIACSTETEPDPTLVQTEDAVLVIDDVAEVSLGIALLATGAIGVVACQDAHENVLLCGSVRHLRRDIMEALATILNGMKTAGLLSWKQCTTLLSPLHKALRSKTAYAGLALQSLMKQLSQIGPQTTVDPGDLEALKDERIYHSFVPELRSSMGAASGSCHLVRFTTTVLPLNAASWTTFMNNRELAIYVNVPAGKDAAALGELACSKLGQVFFAPGKIGFANSKANHACKPKADKRATEREAGGINCPGLRVCVDGSCVNFL
jgi:hypothetical protein